MSNLDFGDRFVEPVEVGASAVQFVEPGGLAQIALLVQHLLIANANEDVREAILRSLQRRGLIAGYLREGSVELLNAPDHLKATLAAAASHGTFRVAERAADLGISVQACNNRLQKLLAAGLLTRTALAPRSGGRQFSYRSPIPAAEQSRDAA